MKGRWQVLPVTVVLTIGAHTSHWNPRLLLPAVLPNRDVDAELVVAVKHSNWPLSAFTTQLATPAGGLAADDAPSTLLGPPLRPHVLAVLPAVPLVASAADMPGAARG